MFFQKKKLTEVRSDEYEKLCKRLVEVESDINTFANRLEIVDAVVKSNRARISKIKVDKILDETETNKKEDTVYL